MTLRCYGTATIRRIWRRAWHRYSTISAKEKKDGKEIDAKKKNGLYIAPKVELGGYIPVNEHLIKIGTFVEYRIGCTKEEDNIFKQRIGRAFVGARFGYVF